MPTSLCPHDEPQRLLELKRLKAMENIREKTYGNYMLMASSLCATPTSAISLIDSDKQWFRATVGLHLKGTARNISFCAHAILQDGVYIVNNAHEDRFFREILWSQVTRGSAFMQVRLSSPRVGTTLVRSASWIIRSACSHRNRCKC